MSNHLHSTLKKFLYTFLVTSLIFSVMKLNISHGNNIYHTRMLSTEKTAKEMTDEMCEKSSSDLKDFYSKNKDFDFTPEEGNSFLNDLFKKLVQGEKNIEIGTDEIIDYSKDNGIYVISLVLFIILIILWIPYIICVCLKKCMCIPDSCAKNLKCCIFISVALSAAVMICCFIGYSKNGDIVNVIYGLGCSILKIEQHVVNGDDYTNYKPYWIGLRNITDKLDYTEKDIKTIAGKSDTIKDVLNNVKQDFEKLEDELDNEYHSKEGRTITDPLSGGVFTPIYLYSYSESLNFIKRELNDFESLTVKKMDEIVDVIDIKGETESIVNNMISISKDLNKTIGDIENSITKYIGKYYDYFDDVDSYVRKIMNILFSLNLALIIAFTVSVLMLIFCKCGGLLVCLFWFFIYIFMLLSFLLGAILGLLSSFAKDSSSAVKIVSKDTSIISFDRVDLLDICINGNGSLSHSNLIPFDFNKSLVDDIYFLENKINDGIILIQNNLNLTWFETNHNIYVNIKEHPDIYIKNLVQTFDKVKDEINNKGKDDIWVIHKDNCTGDYQYLNPSNNLRNLLEENNEGKYCLVIGEWSKEKISERYDDDSSINNYKNNIDAFLDSNDQLLNEIIQKNDEFKESFTKVKNSEIGFLNFTLDVITPLRELYIEFISEGSIFDLLNCGFIKRDFNKVMDTLYNDFGGDFKTTSNLFLAISATELLLTIFVLIIMKGVKAENSNIPDYSTRVQT